MTDTDRRTDRRTAAVEALAIALVQEDEPTGFPLSGIDDYDEWWSTPRYLAERMVDHLDDSGRAAIVAWLLTPERLGEAIRYFGGPARLMIADPDQLADAILARLATPAAQGYADATATSGSYTSTPKTQPAAAQEPKP